MRRVLAAASVLALVFVLAAPATAATPSPKKMAAQIRVLQKQVKTLQKQVKKMSGTLAQTQAVAIVALLYGGCASAATADAFAGSGNPGYAAPPNPVNDYQTCSDLSSITGTTVARQPNTPTVNVFQSLLNIFRPSGSVRASLVQLQH
jgi:endonuclease/exonuclease/phosphatase (EEP) superfamily protein YafD